MARILLVEDEQIISEPFAIVLRAQQYTVDVAGNGLEALALCEKHRYDLVLLDIMMPFCNGIEFLERANLQTSAPQTTVFLLTNIANGEEIMKGMELGAKKCLLKSNVTPRILIDEVRGELDLIGAGSKQD